LAKKASLSAGIATAMPAKAFEVLGEDANDSQVPKTSVVVVVVAAAVVRVGSVATMAMDSALNNDEVEDSAAGALAAAAAAAPRNAAWSSADRLCR
jgi:hypothetical protein